MLTLYHYNLCPVSRMIRILLNEQNIEYELKKVEYWKEQKTLFLMDPLGEIPIIVTKEGAQVVGLYPALEYSINLTPNLHLCNFSQIELAEIRRLVHWINIRFNKEVTSYILSEKLVKLLSKKEALRTEFLRAARINFLHHMNYFYELVQKNGCIASKKLSVADIFLASHISVLDYFGEINWDKHYWLQEWYAPIKSRPSMRPILQEKVAGIKPPDYYEQLDF
ncbi:MAG: glutathione S-transferase family protein [Alphaproteobacteria bacterium]|nr:glutathione S-transferase family protein [Alphaproteobacteria bacterium]